LDRALDFAGHAEDAVAFAHRVGLLLGSRVAWGVKPLEHIHRADIKTDAIGDANIEVHGYLCSMDAELVGRVYGTPDIMALMLFDYLPVLLEIWVYGRHR
jgi:hypothetical protein